MCGFWLKSTTLVQKRQQRETKQCLFASISSWHIWHIPPCIPRARTGKPMFFCNILSIRILSPFFKNFISYCLSGIWNAEKNKPCILKYKALISKYMPCIFCNKPCIFSSIPQRGKNFPKTIVLFPFRTNIYRHVPRHIPWHT